LPEENDNSGKLPPDAWKVVSVAVLGSFLAQMDATLVNVSLSPLAAELHTRFAVIQWVTSGYLLALALMLPLNGWLVERIGAKRLYLVCFTGFTLTSGLCALSWSANTLIAFRVLQGASGGLMAPMAQLMMARVAGKHMARVMGYAAVPILLGPILGPVVAGAILQYASWRWLFLVNLPIGALAVVLALAFLPRDDRETGPRREFDLVGFLLLSPGLVLFLYGADHVSERAGVTAFAFALLLLVRFWRKSVRDGERALIDVQLLRGKVFSASALTQFAANGLSFAGQMLIPAFLMRAAGQPPSRTGWLMAPMGLGMMCTYPALGMLTKRLGIRGTSASGAVLALAGTLPFILLTSRPLSVTMLAASLFVRGIGVSAVGIPSITAAYQSVRRLELPMATTSLNIVQRLGGPTLTTVCATFLGWRLTADHSSAGVASAFRMSFALLSGFHALLVMAAARLPQNIESMQDAPTAEQPVESDEASDQ